MNKKIAALFFIFVHSFSFARNKEEAFLQANRCYQEKKYDNALDLYDSIEKKGTATWYNMGNCAYKLNKHVDAFVFWRRARRGANKKELDDIRTNIAVVHEFLGKTEEPSWFEKFVENLFDRFSLFAFQFLFLFSWLFLFASIWFFRSKKIIFLVLFLPLNLVLGVMLFMKNKTIVYPCAVVKKPATTLLAGPDKDYHVLGKLSVTDEVSVLETRKEWCKVKAGSLAGWTLADKLEVV